MIYVGIGNDDVSVYIRMRRENVRVRAFVVRRCDCALSSSARKGEKRREKRERKCARARTYG